MTMLSQVNKDDVTMTSASNESVWIYTDADNTLWDTNSVFAEAQLALLSVAEDIASHQLGGADRLAFLRQYDQAIAQRHHARLRYPPGLLVRALVLGVQGLSPDVAAARVVSGSTPLSSEEVQAAIQFQSDIARVPPLLSGVREGLEILRAFGIPVYVITEGPLDRAKATAQSLGIDQYLEGVLSATKSTELYQRLADKASPRRAVMIGDQADRDIRLAHAAGLQTVLVKGDFQPKWISERDKVVADAVVTDFAAAIEWVISRYEPLNVAGEKA